MTALAMASAGCSGRRTSGEPPLRLPRRRHEIQERIHRLAAYSASGTSRSRQILRARKFVDFAMPGNRRGFASSAIHIDCVTSSLAQEEAAMTLQMTEQVAALHRS